MPVSDFSRVFIDQSNKSDLNDPTSPFESPCEAPAIERMDPHKNLILLFH
jgi:hypothetical protein